MQDLGGASLRCLESVRLRLAILKCCKEQPADIWARTFRKPLCKSVRSINSEEVKVVSESKRKVRDGPTSRVALCCLTAIHVRNEVYCTHFRDRYGQASMILEYILMSRMPIAHSM